MPHPSGLARHYLAGPCRCGADHRGGVIACRAPAGEPRDPAGYVARVWRDAVPATGTPVERYLIARGLAGPIPPSIRYHADLLHRPSGRTLPAMVAAIARWPEARVAGVHRTFIALDGSGKADVTPQRMMLGSVAGGAVWLAPPAETMALAEGIETALAVRQATDIATWVALSAGNLPHVRLPDLPFASELVIAADHDSAGLHAAMAAAERFTAQGRKVRIAVPQRGDFADLLNERIAA
jgi:hypothetical protein